MEDQEIAIKMEKLARIERRGKEQSARWLKEQRAKGKRQISGLIDQAEYQILSDIKDAGNVVANPISTGQVLGYALRMIKRLCDSDIDIAHNIHNNIDINIVNNIVDTMIEKREPSEPYPNNQLDLELDSELEPEPPVKTGAEEEPKPHKEALQKLDLSGYDLQNLSIDDRDQIIFKVYELYPERQQAQLRVDLLNQNEILFNGNPWTKKQFTDQLSRARERMRRTN